MDLEARRQLQLLEAISADQRITQRGLASRMGVALGLANIYLKRLVRKGYVKCVNVQSNRLLYLLTPKGIAEKTRLTYEYMDYSLRLYRGARLHVRQRLAPLARRASVRVAIYGTGEAAELSYLCLRELGLEPVGVFGDDSASTFFNTPVRSIREHASLPFDVMIVATLENPSGVIASLEKLGIARDRLVPLRDPS
ncbi:MAG TPA: winged helix-turn-helix transcriptional regulator [Vicinamibacterales bacterium]|nr:winged helix-turn-helix transcriptional regulator [Vicinamibacterales bacterium]